MKIWRKRPKHPLEAAFDAHGEAIDALIETVGNHVTDLADARRRIRELEQASHDHCLGCGAMTPHYGMTECGRAACAQRARATA